MIEPSLEELALDEEVIAAAPGWLLNITSVFIAVDLDVQLWPAVYKTWSKCTA